MQAKRPEISASPVRDLSVLDSGGKNPENFFGFGVNDCWQAQASGPDQLKPMCLLERPVRFHLNPKASALSTVAFP